jgi:hypothetical protein
MDADDVVKLRLALAALFTAASIASGKTPDVMQSIALANQLIDTMKL